MSLPSPADTTVRPSSPPPISIPFRFKPKRSLSPTAHDVRPHRFSSSADSPNSPPTNPNATIPSAPTTTPSRFKRKRSPSPAESSIPDPHPTNTSASPSSGIKPIRFKSRRGATYRPNYPNVPAANNDEPNHRSDSSHETPPKSTAKPKPKPKNKKHPRLPKQPKRRDRHPSSRRPDEENPPDHHHPQWDAQTDPDTAFRESLFDAMADDEGAAFWEGVYGQPIHTYSAYYRTAGAAADDDDDADDPQDPDKPRLEKMTDDEYVRYVRNKMYEKTHGYIFEERAKREARKEARREAQKKAARKQRSRKQEKSRKRWDMGVEEALRRGEERRRRVGEWKGVWEEYLGAWNGAGEVVKGEERYADRIRWPVQSGQRRDVGREEIKKFFEHAPHSGGGGGNVVILEVLKKERVRWHPDKMQQRAGEGGLDNETTKLVTAVFQIIDRLWSEQKGGA